MSDDDKPALPFVLGSGALADEMRRMIEADPDRYRAETWSMDPVGKCPCCGQKVYSAKTRHTAFLRGFLTMAEPPVIHPSFDLEGKRDPDGPLAGCCCKDGEWGPKHSEPKKPPRGRKAVS